MANDELRFDKQKFERVEILEKWAILKHSTVIASIGVVHAFALHVADELNIISKLLIKVNNLEALWL